MDILCYYNVLESLKLVCGQVIYPRVSVTCIMISLPGYCNGAITSSILVLICS